MLSSTLDSILSPVGDFAGGLVESATPALQGSFGQGLGGALGAKFTGNASGLTGGRTQSANNSGFNFSNWLLPGVGVLALIIGIIVFQSNNAKPKRRRPKSRTARQRQLAALAKGRRTAARNRKKKK